MAGADHPSVTVNCRRGSSRLMRSVQGEGTYEGSMLGAGFPSGQMKAPRATCDDPLEPYPSHKRGRDFRRTKGTLGTVSALPDNSMCH